MSTAALARPPAHLAHISSNDAETTGANVGAEETTLSKPSVASPNKIACVSWKAWRSSRVSCFNWGRRVSQLQQWWLFHGLPWTDHYLTWIWGSVWWSVYCNASNNPKTNPLPYLQRPKFPRPSFTARKYKISILSEDPNAAETAQSTDDFSDLADAFQDISINPNFPDEWREDSDIDLKLAKLALRVGPSVLAARSNHFPGINMTFDWNGDCYAILDRVIWRRCGQTPRPWGKEENIGVLQRIQFLFSDETNWIRRGEIWAAVREIVCWKRLCGTTARIMVGNKKHVFKKWRGKPVLWQIMTNFLDIGENVIQWKKSNFEAKSNSLKRKAHVAPEAEGLVALARKFKTAEKVSVKVMSDEWRARRRLQEKKSGSWTNGTLRMDGMWDEFHWVLNLDDPRHAHWGREAELLSVQRGPFSSTRWFDILREMLWYFSLMEVSAKVHLAWWVQGAANLSTVFYQVFYSAAGAITI